MHARCVAQYFTLSHNMFVPCLYVSCVDVCSVHSTLLIAWLCDHRRRREELSFSQRWTPTEEKTYQFCQLAFILGVFFFFILSVAVTFITSYDHPGRNTATLISGTILLCAASVIAPILHKEYRRCVVNDC